MSAEHDKRPRRHQTPILSKIAESFGRIDTVVSESGAPVYTTPKDAESVAIALESSLFRDWYRAPSMDGGAILIAVENLSEYEPFDSLRALGESFVDGNIAPDLSGKFFAHRVNDLCREISVDWKYNGGLQALNIIGNLQKRAVEAVVLNPMAMEWLFTDQPNPSKEDIEPLVAEATILFAAAALTEAMMNKMGRQMDEEDHPGAGEN